MYKFMLLIAILTCYSCGNIEKRDAIGDMSTKKATITIDIDNSKMSKVLYLKEVFEKMKIIALESADANIFTVSKLITVDSLIIVLDKRIGNQVSVFDLNGKLKFKIGAKGHGQGEYIDPNDMTIDRDSMQLYILDTKRGLINKYDLIDGHYIGRIIIDNSRGVRSFFMHLIDSKIYADAYFPKKDKNNYLLRTMDKSSGTQTSKNLSKEKYNCNWDELYFLGNSPFSELNTYMPLFSNIFFKLESDNIIPYIEIFSDKLIDAKYIATIDDSYANKKYLSLLKSDKIYSFSQLIETSQFVMFKYNEGNRKRLLQYDSEDKKSTIFSSVVNDFIFKRDSKFNIPTNFVYVDKHNRLIYSSIDSNDMKLIEKSLERDEVLDRYIDLLSKDGKENVMLCQYEYN